MRNSVLRFDIPLLRRVAVQRKRLRRWLAIIAAVPISGCVVVGPDFDGPPAPQVSGYTARSLPAQTAAAKDAIGTAQRFAFGRDIPGDWWHLFGSRALESLLQRALDRNPDLAAAEAALRVAQANVAAGRGAFFPAIDAGIGAGRQQNGVGSGAGVAPRTSTYDLFTAQVQVSYVPDVFGGTQRLVESLEAQAENQRFQLEATYLALTANIVIAAIQEASLRGQIAATRRLVDIATDLLNMLRHQKRVGTGSEVDVLAQQAEVAQIEQSLALLEGQLAQQRHLLSALTGGVPSEEPPEKFEIKMLHLPPDLPVSVPSKLVEGRPDIRAAVANMHYASALIGVAAANRLPNISLTAGYGVNALSVDQLFVPGSSAWNLAGAALMPIVHGGTLLQREVAAREGFDQAASQYQSVAVAAFKNVADCLTALQTDAVALQKAVAFETAAAGTLTLTRQRLEVGDINYLELLNAQRTYLRALTTLAVARSNRLSDTAALFQALGGGWWNRADVAAPDVAQHKKPTFIPISFKPGFRWSSPLD